MIGSIKKYWYIWAIWCTIAVYLIFFRTKTVVISTDQVHTVATHTIQESIQAVWEVSLLHEQQLAFGVGGTIKKINVSIGDSVKKWQVLAEIDASKQKNQIAQAKKNYEISLTKLEQIKNWWKESTLLQLQNEIQQNQLKLNELSKDIPLTTIQASNSVNKIENQITDTKNQIILLENKKKIILGEIEALKLSQWTDGTKTTQINLTTFNTAKDLIQSSLAKAQDASSFFDVVYGVSIVNTNARDRTFLWAKNFSLKQQWSTNTSQLMWLFDKANTVDYKSIAASEQGITQITSLINDIIVIMSNIQSLSSSTNDLLKNYSVVWGDLTDSRLNQYESKMDSLSSSSESMLNSLQSKKKELLTTDSTQLTDLKNSNSLESKQAELLQNGKDLSWQLTTLSELQATINEQKLSQDYQIIQKTNEQQNLSGQITLLQTQVTEQKNYGWQTKYDVIKAQQDLELQRLQIEQAELSLNDYQLVAYEDGVVIDFDFSVGENMTVSDTNNIMTIGIPGQYQVELSLDQVDVIKLTKDMEATISLNALPDVIFTGKVDKIGMVPTKSNNVNSYKVTISFDNQSRTLVSGMIGTVTVITKQKDNTIAVPITAVIYSGTQWYVSMYQSWDTTTMTRSKKIEIGMSDATMIEISSWLRLGEQILKVAKDISWPTESKFWPPWGGRKPN